MQLVTFHLLFLLISIIFINKCAKTPFYALAISFYNFFHHKQPNKFPLGCVAQHSTWNVSNSSMVIISYFITWNFQQGCYKILPLGGHYPRCSITHIPQQPTERRHTAYGALQYNSMQYLQ